jgi:probable phosphoglycerate mutase
MKILIIRHGDPNYAIDSLTEKGWKEAEYLADRIAKLDVKQFYVSPLGRAKDTASFTLQKMKRDAIECEWLREFAPRIVRLDRDVETVVWDWLPQDWTIHENFYQYDHWHEHELFRQAGVKEESDWIISNFDALLAEYGYIRKGHFYEVKQATNDTIVLFCHFGVGCILIGHLLGISPMVLWHGMCAAPTSVATITTEERRKGIASFRMSAYGDISHLYAVGEEPAFAARFCECFDNVNERHD